MATIDASNHQLEQGAHRYLAAEEAMVCNSKATWVDAPRATYRWHAGELPREGSAPPFSCTRYTLVSPCGRTRCRCAALTAISALDRHVTGAICPGIAQGEPAGGGALADHVDERAQCHSTLAVPRVAQEETIDGRTPLLEDPDQLPGTRKWGGEDRAHR